MIICLMKTEIIKSRKDLVTLFRYAKYCLVKYETEPNVLRTGGYYTGSQLLGIRSQAEKEEGLLYNPNCQRMALPLKSKVTKRLEIVVR